MFSELKNKIKDRIIQKDETLLKALKQMDIIDKKLLLVFDNEKFINILSIGDIQRAILKKFPLETKVYEVMRQNTVFARSIKLKMKSEN